MNAFRVHLEPRVHINIQLVADEVLEGTQVTLFRLARKHGGTNCAASSPTLLEQCDGDGTGLLEHVQSIRREFGDHGAITSLAVYCKVRPLRCH